MCEQLVSSKPQIQAGNIKGIANLSKERSPIMPDLPTAYEQGIDVQAYAWTALFLPRRTPDAIVQTLNKAVVQTMHTPAVRARSRRAGPLGFGRSHEPAISCGLRQERDRAVGRAIKASGVSMD